MHVDLVSEAQHDSLVELLCELHAYYNEGAVVAPALVREHLVENLLGPGSAQRVVVASDDTGRVVGLAAIGLVYSLVEAAPDKRRHCQLKELYVRSSSRGRGVGRALMAWVARYAWDHGCRRVDWPVKASNARGITFYEGLGAERVVERLSYRLNEAALRRLATLPAATPGSDPSAAHYLAPHLADSGSDSAAHPTVPPVPAGPDMNALHIIIPYRVEGIWAFDDAAKGLQREPFVEETNGFLDAMTAHIPNAGAGFRLIFSARPFPGFALSFQRQRAEFDGHWYACDQLGGEGWLCPALLKYFESAPPELYAKAEAIG